MSWIIALTGSFMASMSFGILFNVPRRSLIMGGLAGAFGWIIYVLLVRQLEVNIVAATLMAAFGVATVSQILARFLKMPVTVFSIAGIIPLVPGGMAYDTMRHFIENNYIEGIRLGTITLLLAGSIAFGLIFSGVLTDTFSRRNKFIPKSGPSK